MSRKLDFSKFHTSDDDEDGLALPKSKLDLSETKAKIFSQGNLRKSKKDLEREAEERKAKEEAEASAKALEEFTAAFDGDGVEDQPLGGMGGGFRRGRGGGFVRAGGDPSGSGSQYHMGNAYAPPRAPAAMMPKAMRPPPPAAFAPPSPPRGAPKPKGKRAMDAFLEEIKKDQEIRDKKFGHAAKMGGSSVSSLAAMQGVKNIPEVASTNLFISNLPGIVTEESLGLFFAQHGPVGTVKIMWPRGDFETMAARRAKPALTGFVAFMKRDDAEKALNATDGQDFAGTLLRVSWGKPAPIPPRPIYDLNPGQNRGRSRSPKPHRRDEKRDRSRSRSDSRSRSPARKRHRSRTRSPTRSRSPGRGRDSRGRGRSRSRSFSVSSRSSRSRSRSPRPKMKPASEKERYLATVPETSSDFIKAVASKVKQFGPEFERMLLEKEKANAKFAFLRDEKIPEYHIYKLAVDGRHRVPTPPPFDFEDEGYASVYSSDSAEESERERTVKGKLGKIARKRFEACLRGMSGIRAEIARAMEFAMQKADAADDIAEIVCQSLRVEDTPVPRKMARLYLISDILHNSASPMPNVWKYRLAFENRLPPVFTHFCAVHRSLNAYSGKIAADVFKQQVLGMVEIWENWIVFTPGMTDKLRLFFDGATEASLAPVPAPKPVEPEVAPSTEPAPSRFKKGGFKAAFVPVAAAPVAPAAPEPDVDLDGEIMDDDLDGEAMEDLDGEDMDGEDMDGEAMEDVDGEAM